MVPFLCIRSSLLIQSTTVSSFLLPTTQTAMATIQCTDQRYKLPWLPSSVQIRDTNCHGYHPVYRSERHCYDECHLNLSLEIQGMIPVSVIKERRFNGMVYPGASELVQIKSNCTTRCHKIQCNSDDFVPVLIHSIPRQRLEVVLQASPDSLFKTISQPKISLIDFVTYIISCVGFWFGISCFHFTEKCLRFTRSRWTTNQFSIPARVRSRDKLLKNRTSHVQFLLNRSIEIRLRRLEEFVAKIS